MDGEGRMKEEGGRRKEEGGKGREEGVGGKEEGGGREESKLNVKLFPLNNTTHQTMLKLGNFPRLALKISENKPLKIIIDHLKAKWLPNNFDYELNLYPDERNWLTHIAFPGRREDLGGRREDGGGQDEGRRDGGGRREDWREGGGRREEGGWKEGGGGRREEEGRRDGGGRREEGGWREGGSRRVDGEGGRMQSGREWFRENYMVSDIYSGYNFPKSRAFYIYYELEIRQRVTRSSGVRLPDLEDSIMKKGNGTFHSFKNPHLKKIERMVDLIGMDYQEFGRKEEEKQKMMG